MSSRAVYWYLQRITGGALLLLLTLHFWVEHYTAEVRRDGLTFAVIQQRFFQNRWFVAIDIAFLVVALFHGLNGCRNILFDFDWVAARHRKTVNLLLVIVGVVVAYWGIDALAGNPHLRPPGVERVTPR